jgi:hypothetical protein
MRLRGSLGRATLGVAISVVALVLVFRSVDVAAAWQVLRTASPAWIALMVVLIALDVLLRAVRWRVLLRPVAEVRLSSTLASLLVGYLANNVLPARLGEVVRAHDLGTRTGVSRSAILGTIVVERVVDTAAVVVIAAVAILVLSVRGIVASAVLAGLALTALLVLALAVGIFAHRLPGAERVGTFIGRWPRVRITLARLHEGLSVARRGRTMGAALVLTLASWTCAVLAFAAAAQAVGVEPTMGQAALLAAGTNLATAIPAGPGYIGTFELATVAIAASVGIDRESALALAVLIHLAALLLTSLGGAAVLVFGGRRARTRAHDPVRSTTDGGEPPSPDLAPSRAGASVPSGDG